MPIVIAGGSSVGDYDKNELFLLAKHSFTFTVNDSAFRWPCDIIVAMDFMFITKNVEKLKKLGKPIVTRQWENFEQFGLDLVFIPQELIHTYPNSGMVACKLSDAMARRVEKTSYVVGMDDFGKHYYDDELGEDTTRKDFAYVLGNPKLYEDMKLTNTINLGVHSRISCWPKQSKLPHIKKTAVHLPYHIIGAAWVKGYARKIMAGEPTC